MRTLLCILLATFFLKAEDKKSYSSEKLLETFLGETVSWEQFHLVSDDFKTPHFIAATKHDTEVLLGFNPERLAVTLRNDKNAANEILGTLLDEERYFVGEGCGDSEVSVHHFEGVSIWCYDMETYVKIDLQNEQSQFELATDLGTAYTSKAGRKTYLGINAGCTAHDDAKYCYQPLIWVVYEGGSPRWLYVGYFLTC